MIFINKLYIFKSIIINFYKKLFNNNNIVKIYLNNFMLKSASYSAINYVMLT